MTHLLAELLRLHDGVNLAGIMAAALVGGALALVIALRPPRPLDHIAVRIAGFALILTAASWVSFLLALRSAFPQIRLAIPLPWAAAALGVDLVASASAIGCALLLRRSARTAMLAGSLLACGKSCVIFIAMTGLVQPFALAYDLPSVVLIMSIGAVCWVLAFRRLDDADPSWRFLVTVLIVGIAGTLLPIGSFASILPLEAWMNALDQPDNLSSAPIAVIAVTEAAVVLALSLFGSLVDNRTSARDRLEVSRLRQLADSTFEGIVVHRNGAIVDANERLADMLGLPLRDVVTSPLTRFLDAVAACEPGTAGSVRETEMAIAGGERIPVEVLSRSIAYGGVPATVTALRDIRERKASEERIRFLAHHDMLTGLPNRVTLADRLGAALDHDDHATAPVAVLCLDLDGFKLVNDTLGHAAGDLLLQHVADRIRVSLDEGAFVARVGGDEFVVVQNEGPQPETAIATARCILEALTSPFDLNGQVVSVGTSIGIAQSPQDGNDPTLLLKKADIALYQAKHDGRGWYSLFENGMDQSISERQSLESDLRAAFAAGELSLAFQPLFGQEREILSFEALVRWTHPVRGPVPPSEFIPIAEQSGLIFPLSRWVLKTACTAAQDWTSTCRVAVNLSPAQFLRGDLFATVTAVLAETGFDPTRLELEITEGVLMDNTDRTLATLNQLRGLGIHLVLDDFGTGYSSLSYLHRFPLDKLKVDRSFIQRMQVDTSARAIISAVIAMSRSLSLEVTAEGVETLDQFDVLRREGCDAFQGYALSRPLPQSQIQAYLDAQAALPQRADSVAQVA